MRKKSLRYWIYNSLQCFYNFFSGRIYANHTVTAEQTQNQCIRISVKTYSYIRCKNGRTSDYLAFYIVITDTNKFYFKMSVRYNGAKNSGKYESD